MVTFVPLGMAAAQVEGPPGPRGFERVERWKKVRMIEALDLSEEQSARLFARLNEVEKKRRELMRRRGELLDRLDVAVNEHADSLEIEKIFSDVESVDQEMSKGRRDLFRGLGDLLTLEQRARFLLFERRFERELRDAMREVQRRRHPMPE